MTNLYTITWQPDDPDSVSAALRAIAASLEESNPIVVGGFDSPVGTLQERQGSVVWPSDWFDATGYAKYYEIRSGVWNYHTGADLNRNKPTWDSDRGAAVFACADGVVTHSGMLGGTWNQVVVIKHPDVDGHPVYTRYAHVFPTVNEGDRVQRGYQIAIVDRPNYTGSAYHLHFDISLTNVLGTHPQDWPGNDLDRVKRDYTNPLEFILSHRP